MILILQITAGLLLKEGIMIIFRALYLYYSTPQPVKEEVGKV